MTDEERLEIRRRIYESLGWEWRTAENWTVAVAMSPVEVQADAQRTVKNFLPVPDGMERDCQYFPDPFTDSDDCLALVVEVLGRGHSVTAEPSGIRSDGLDTHTYVVIADRSTALGQGWVEGTDLAALREALTLAAEVVLTGGNS